MLASPGEGFGEVISLGQDRDEHGLPRAGAALERLCRLVAVLVSVWLLLVGLWEVAGPFGAGHAAVVPARGIMAENMLEWGIVGPVRWYTLERPGPNAFYSNHPWGSLWLHAVSMSLLGRHELTFRLLPVLTTAGTPWLLYATGRALYGPPGGALAALGYGSLPVVLSFANFPGFEGSVVFCCACTAWASLRFLQTWRRRWLVASALSFLVGFHTDWEFYVFAALAVGSTILLHGLLPRRWYGTVDRGRLVTWVALTVSFGVASLALYYAAFDAAGGFDALMAQGRFRAGAHRAPLSEVLDRRAYWIEVMFTPAAIFVGKVALPLLGFRLLVQRRSGEVFPLAMLAMALVHYVVFENGADIHIYWPLTFAPYYALALGNLGHGSGYLFNRILRAMSTGKTVEPRWRLAMAACGLIPASMLPDAVTALEYARNTGLRLNDNGHLNLQDLDKAAALGTFAQSIPEGQVVSLHPSLQPNWAQEWILRRPVRFTASPPPRNNPAIRFAVLDSRFTPARELRQLASEYAVSAVGPFWLVDGAGEAGSLTGFALDAREPTLGEMLLVQAHDPIYSVRRDDFAQWELEVHYGGAARLPSGAAQSTEQKRIAHNIAVRRGDKRGERRLVEELLAGCDTQVKVHYERGIELLAACHRDGVSPRTDLYFRASGPLDSEVLFDVRSRIEAKRTFSWVRLDDKEKRVAPGFVIAPRLWRPGFVYGMVVEFRQRPGRERFYARWRSLDGTPPPRAIGHTEPVLLRVLP